MKKEWFFDRFCGAQIAVYTEDGIVTEAMIEQENAADLTGTIYKGRVCNLVPGMQAAFISCGLERNCYLPLGEGAARFTSYDGEGNLVSTPDLKEGDEILVQIVKPPRGTKGAKVTCDLSFVGKTLIYLPHTNFLGISRKITDPALRERLLKDADKLREPGAGFIVRTAAATADKRHLRIESEYLKRVWRSVCQTAQSAQVGDAVYREFDLPFRVMRDSLGDGVTRLYVGDRELFEKIVTLARLRPDIGERRVTYCPEEENTFRKYGLTPQLRALCSRTAPMENGGYLVIDRTEAMTVIDVNTGKFTGEDSLEETVFETNLVAVREIARQVRLRNIGGLVAVDFIDMTEEAHRTAIDTALTEALAVDRAKCRVMPMSDMCVSMFTRKRTGGDILDFFLSPCPHCTRQGFVYSDQFLAITLRGDLLELFADDYEAAIVDLSRDYMKRLLAGRYLSAEVSGIWKDKRIYLVPHADWHEEKFTVRGDNSGVLNLPDDARLLY